MPGDNTTHSFAIVPAAGRSRRMGQPKLLLRWGATTVIESVVGAWLRSDCTRVVVVARSDQRRVRSICRRIGADVVVPPEDPPEMKDSVAVALRYIASEFGPGERDVWLLAPADMPRLSTEIINRIVAAHDNRDPAILVPVVDQQRAHPVLFPWSLAVEVEQLGCDEGVNALLKRHPTRNVAIGDRSLLEDLDTPADYERMSRSHADDA